LQLTIFYRLKIELRVMEVVYPSLRTHRGAWTAFSGGLQLTIFYRFKIELRVMEVVYPSLRVGCVALYAKEEFGLQLCLGKVVKKQSSDIPPQFYPCYS
uniref:Ovule protein n=1 Tax=Gongylonema pulchrum TaxID=637853 RepID=A0A183DYW5_9BILA